MPRKQLIVVVPAWNGDLAAWNSLLERLQAEPELEGSDWLRWRYDPWTRGDAPAKLLARELSARIHAEWTKAGGFDRILLLGHSLGGLLARQAYLFAGGDEPGYAASYPWADRVTRLVLFASVNRGFDWERSRLRRGANWLVQFAPVLRSSLLRDIMRGSEFLTNMRIAWIRRFARLGDQAPQVVQLLGSRDNLVSRRDSVDIEQFRTAFHAEIPAADHRDLIRLDTVESPEDREARYTLIREAVLSAAPQHAENVEVKGPRQVIFLTHGIRARDFEWPREAEEMILGRGAEDGSVEVVKPTRGYFSALRFALPATRKRNLQLFRDEYSDALARNPDAEFHYIGHSNGTYLLGHSLLAVPGMRFGRLALAGSVLPPDYPWDDLIRSGQVGYLRNERAARDVPWASCAAH